MNMFMSWMQPALKWGMLVWFLVGCGSLPTLRTTPTADFAVLAQRGAKQLATVYISPTPNVAEQQATRLASTVPVEANVLVAVVPSPTPYVGIFLGDAASIGGAILNITVLAGIFTPTANVSVANKIFIKPFAYKISIISFKIGINPE